MLGNNHRVIDGAWVSRDGGTRRAGWVGALDVAMMLELEVGARARELHGAQVGVAQGSSWREEWLGERKT